MLSRLLPLLLSLSLFTSCAVPGAESPAPAPEPALRSAPVEPAALTREPASTAEAVARAVLDSQPDRDGCAAQTGEDLELYLTGLYALEDTIGMDAAVYAASGVDGREVAVIRPESMTSEGATVAAALEEYRQNRLGDFLGYAPDQAALVEGGAVVSGQSCVALLICEDMDRAKAAFEEAAGEASVYVPPEETAAPVGLSPEETRWFVPFDPPHAFDMTPYDTSAILTAWKTGDESGLGEKDAAILAKCREVVALCVREGMSDLEKELALHDWLVEHCAYDRTTHDPHTPLGRANNMDPYGPLVNGYGICLGYTSAFQLLMDMAGVECVTVVGAANGSREDHAWNMVRLAGEWYCVDVTWDDPTLTASAAYTEEALVRLRHRYFNVTSQHLRDTNHQWDYQNVPEATADRFRWDGTGELPQ